MQTEEKLKKRIAYEKMLAGISEQAVSVYNLGTGRGCSVLAMVRAFERVNSIPVPYRVVERRPGDIATCYADPSRAERELGWNAELGIEEMVRDSWRWQSANPQGYGMDRS